MIEVHRSAVISPCGRYRYRLERRWADTGPNLTFIMHNPSTADAHQDDPTIRRCMAFARREGMSGMVVLNRYAYRSPHPRDLFKTIDPIGDDNAEYLAGADGVIVAAWGAIKGPDPDYEVALPMVLARGRNLWCLGQTKSLAPRHPLYLKQDACLHLWVGAL